MAGRGTDIKLGGNPTFMAVAEMEKLGYSPALISFADSYLQPSNEEEKMRAKSLTNLNQRLKNKLMQKKLML